MVVTARFRRTDNDNLYNSQSNVTYGACKNSPLGSEVHEETDQQPLLHVRPIA